MAESKKRGATASDSPSKRAKTGNQLEQLSAITTIVADTGDIDQIRE